MIKKIIAATVISSVALFALPNNEIELALISKASEKKAIVLATMALDAEKKEKFGNLYDEYQEKLMKTRISELELIAEYAKNYNNMTDENANKLIKQWVSDQETKLTLQKSYMAEFKKILPSADVIRYFQIENRLELLRKIKTSSVIPLAIPSELKVK
jgi:hypothetical protein